MISSRLRLARSLPFRALCGRAALAVSRRFFAALERRRDTRDGSYEREIPEGALQVICQAVSRVQIDGQKSWIDPAAKLCLEHRFNLLGSGWVHVAYGIDCVGTDGHRYEPADDICPDREGQWLTGRINLSNLRESKRIWRLIDPAYTPIDWQLDFKSGFRWRECEWSGDITFGNLDGVDIKVPWELARMQHLIVLAWAHRLCEAGEAGSSRFAAEYRNQLLDFIATNPPRFGVNWRCTMDVAIRAANWIVAYGFFRAHGHQFDAEFEAILARSLHEHGRHIALHLEFYPEGRANHYLADIAGLMFIAAGLASTQETDGWLALALQELADETAAQFNADGSNFEGSTCYHRLSLEMVTYATSLALALPEDRSRQLTRSSPATVRTRPRRPLVRSYSALPPAHAEILERAASFTATVARANGRMIQIGDNDNGRFLKPHPVYRDLPSFSDGPFREDSLDHRGVIAAVHRLTGNPDIAECIETDRLDGAVVAALSGDRKLGGDGSANQAAKLRVGSPDEFQRLLDVPSEAVELAVPGGRLREGLVQFGYPDFGLWVFRSNRLHLAIRCGPTSSPRAGGSHAHNDQLSIDLAIDDEAWLEDPGSYLYCSPLDRRNQWRSVAAHAAPKWPGREPARLDLGAFRLANSTQARCLYFGPRGFAGEHLGYEKPVARLIELDDNKITIADHGLPSQGLPRVIRCDSKEATRKHFAQSAPYSPGYGEIETQCAF